MLIELFLLGVMAYALGANIDLKSVFSLQRGQLDAKFHVKGLPTTKHSSLHKTRVNDLSCGIRMWAEVSFVLSQIPHLTDGWRTDGWTDRQTASS